MRTPGRRLRAHLQAAKARNELHVFFLRVGVVCLLVGAVAGAAYASTHPAKGTSNAALQTNAGSPAYGGTVENGGPYRSAQVPKTISYTQLTAALHAHQVTSATMRPATHRVQVKLTSGKQEVAYFPPALEQQLTDQMTSGGVNLTVASTTPGSGIHAGYVVIICLSIVLLLVLLMARMNRSGRPATATGRNQNRQMMRVRDAADTVPDVRFADVAGCDEAVGEVREMVDFLSNPVHYSQVGARMPAGIVLYGPPGTGKTLLAKAVAGESGVPFFAMSGSEFVEMYVGVGASRVRDLFQKARAKAPCVVFIDEIDAVGRKRGGHGGGHQEQETTLNEILVQLDGFNGRENVVVIAATNRLDTLDEALLRPGRLTRHVHVGLPAEQGRLEILRVHSRSKPIGADVDLPALAASTAGSSGAQLAEMLNEGAIMAARERAEVIGHAHLWEGFLRVIAGPRKAHATLAPGEKETIAYHEAGHVLCAELCPSCDPTLHATISPRGRAAGFAVIAQSDRALHNEQFIHEQLIYILGGRAAEYVVNATVSSGAANDLEKANRIARQAVEQLGLSPHFGQMISGERGLSQEMSAVADREVRRLVDEAYVDAVNLIQEHREQLDRLSEALISSGDIDRQEIVAAMRGAVAAPRQPKQPLRIPISEPVNTPAKIAAPTPDARWRRRIRGSLAGEIAGAVATSVAGIISQRRARRDEADDQGLAGV